MRCPYFQAFLTVSCTVKILSFNTKIENIDIIIINFIQ